MHDGVSQGPGERVLDGYDTSGLRVHPSGFEFQQLTGLNLSKAARSQSWGLGIFIVGLLDKLKPRITITGFNLK